jgi:glycosyltransferase involved in cell wall biosynthesis
MNGLVDAAVRRLAFVVDTGESTEDPGVGRFYGGLIGGLRAVGFDVTPVGLHEEGSAQLSTLSTRLSEGAPRRGRRLALLRQTAGDLRDVVRWNRERPAAGRFDVVLEFQYNGRFEGWRIARRDSSAHLVFIDQIESICPPRRSAVGPALRRLERKRYLGADAVLFRTGALARAYIERWGEPRAWAISHMAVDPSEFTASPGRRRRVREIHGIGNDEVVVGSVAFFAPYHRPELVGPLVEQLRAEGIPARGVLVGGWANATAALLERVRRESPSDWANVVITGAVAQDEVPGMIDMFDVGLMPGSNWYGSPTKILEYGAMSTPVVAARTDAVEEVIRNRTEGLLADSDAELLDLILATIREPAAADDRVAAFRERVLDEHTWAHRARDIAELVR